MLAISAYLQAVEGYFMTNLIKTFIDGGPLIMSCLLLCSIIAVIIIIEKYMYLKKIKRIDETAVKSVTDALKKGKYDEAAQLCDKSPSPMMNMIKAGIDKRTLPKEQVEESVKSAAGREIPKLERNLTTLGTIANVATLIGLLGTVLGNMQAFGLIGSQNALGSMDVLAGGIAKALVTTAAGLIVSIPALIFYNHFTHQVSNIILAMETTANDIVALIIYGGQNGENRIKNDKEAPMGQEKKQDLFV